MSETKEKKNSLDVKKEVAADVFKKAEPKDFSKVLVERTEASKIMIPDGMSHDIAIEWLTRDKASEEKVVTFSHDFRAYPLDGAYALYRAMGLKYGFVDVGESGPSSKPAHMVGVKLPDGSTIQIPWGQLQFPGLEEGSYLETKWNSEKMMFTIAGKYKQKWKARIDEIVDITRYILETESIYKGHAIRVDLAWMNNKDIHPVDPIFMDKEVSKINDSDLLMNDATRTQYNTSILMRIKNTKLCLKKGIPLKHGCLLAGPYGTGKTLTAKYTAKKAIEHGWTFIYLEQSTQIKNALRVAEMYAPAIIFAEDIDKAVEGDRSVQLNDILNTMDGIDTKSKPIITILTTNRVEQINKAFMRAGRIDSLIFMNPLDEETAMQFIKNFGRATDGENMLLDEDYTEAAQALSGIVPAFCSEIMHKAKMNAMYRSGEDAKIGNDDIKGAAKAFKQHIEFTKGKKELSFVEKVGLNTLEREDLLDNRHDENYEDLRNSVDSIFGNDDDE